MNSYKTFRSGVKKGQPKTLTDRVIRYLIEGRELQEVASKSKYRQFTGPNIDTNYFAGKAGAVRTGKCASNSKSLTDFIHKTMIAWEIENGLYKGE
ncbi:MAG: hypothetical protein WC503_04070 [Candidatus Shapirobacteria bacterium]